MTVSFRTTSAALAAVLFAAALILLAPSGGRCAERAVTLAEALELALATHEDVQVAGEGVAQARANLGKATSTLLPTITAQGSYTMYSEQKRVSGFLIQPDDSSTIELLITQPLFAGGTKWNARRQAVIGVESSRVGLDAVREDLLLATATAYFNVLKAASGLEIAEAARLRAEERLKVARARFDVGEVTRADVLRAEAEAAEAEAELIRSRSLLTDSVNLLRRLTGITGDLTTVEPVPAPDVDMDIDELLKTAYAKRRDYRRSVLDEHASEEGVKVAKGSFLPTLDAEGSYVHRDQHPSTTFLLEDSVSGTLVLRYPLFEGLLRKNELDEARSLLRENELRRLALKRDIEVEVRDDQNNLATLRAVLESLSKQVAFAEEDYKMVFEQFKYGVATTVDVVDSDANLVAAQRSLASARYDFEIAKLRLKRTIGVLLDEYASGAFSPAVAGGEVNARVE